MPAAKEKPNFLKLILQPLRDPNFKNLITFLSSWSFAVNLAAPFFTVYMLKRLELDMSFVIVLAVVSQLISLAFFECGENSLVVAIHIYTGISAAGVSLASGNIGLKLVPKGQATAFLATTNLINSLAAGVAPVLGGRFADFFAERELSWTLRWTSPGKDLAFQTLNLQQWDFFFLLAFLIGLYSIHRLARVKEIGEIKERIVIHELMSEIGRTTRNLSTVGGLRHITQFSFSIVRATLKKNKSNGI